MRLSRCLFLIVLAANCFLIKAIGQSYNTNPFKKLTVADGLPQSVVSGLIQDSTGFIWIGTRDGLARYDGKNFKVFRHVPDDSTSLASNIITSLFLDAHNRLWILYETGDMDILNTQTEVLFHFSDDAKYRIVHDQIKPGHSIVEDTKGNTWMLCFSGGIFICNFNKHTLHYYSDTALGLAHNKIAGISSNNGNIMLVTDTALVMMDDNIHIHETAPYTFNNPHVYDAAMPWKDASSIVRKNGDIIIQDVKRTIIYQPSKTFITVPLPDEHTYSNRMVQDDKGKVYFDYGKDIYILSVSNVANVWKPKNENPVYGFKSLLLDRSGVLWMGSNGGGIQLFDLRLSHLQGMHYETSFQNDILKNNLHVPAKDIKQSFLSKIDAYPFRWAKSPDNKIWFSRADKMLVIKPEICYYQNNHLVQPTWHYTDTASATHVQVNVIGFSKSGKMWGIDFFMRPVFIDTSTHAITVYPSIAAVNTGFTYTANSLLIDGEDKFWVSTAMNGLYCYEKSTGRTLHYAHSKTKGTLPTNQLMNLIQDTFDSNILWIGSMGGGLIKFDKAKGKSIFFTEHNGLPNNTVYAVIADNTGTLWCSSNKGIFSFDVKTNSVLQSFTSKDGLAGDEFNRYHFFKLPDGSIAFGGIDGYVVFNPLSIANDNYQPNIALTGIDINNAAADYGYAASPFKQAFNSLNEIKLPYNQNFLTFEFAALQFNIPEKIKYRYQLEGVNKEWIYVGTNNIAAYTNLSPGDYVFKVNATNTSGKWSRYVKTIAVIIQPPFWKSWWFTTLWIVAAVVLVYFLISYRIKTIRTQERKKSEFERQASELKEQALRAQMNPHFIFNCLNSIKSLIHEGNKREAIIYLNTFSKLIRKQMNNAQQEITLHDELETCKIYAELEALRFGTGIVCKFHIDEAVDTMSLHVPPLIIQPFIENAIWHGVLPKEAGTVTVSVTQRDEDTIQCSIEDDGIGREISKLNKLKQSATYESKGMKLVKNRLDLYNTIHNSGGSIEVIDKKITGQKPSGTLVIITFKNNHDKSHYN